MEKKVCIIILSYKNYEMTLQMIKQIRQFSYKNYEILVVDNNSPDDTSKMLDTYKNEFGYKLIINKENLGYAKGNNIGINYSIDNGFDYSWVINNDLIIKDKDIIQKFIKTSEEHLNVAIVGPKIFDLNQNVCAPYYKRPSLWDMTFGIKAYSSKRKKMIDNRMEVYRLHGCCLFMKNDMIKQVGLFDPSTFLYCEEEILAEKLLKYKYCSYYDSTINIIHMESSTIGINRGKKSKFKRQCYKNSMKIYLRSYRKFNVIATRLCIIVRCIMIYFRG